MIINTFWHGSQLSLLEKLTLKSFLNHGYRVKLWVYTRDHDISCPADVEICDANKVIPEGRIFHYTGNGDCRKDSLGGFSDLFRYYLLYQNEGVYVDMDSTCLDFFDFSADYIIKPHIRCGTVANVLKAPVGSDFLKTCIDLTEQKVNKDNSSWILPVQIFNYAVHEHKLIDYIVPTDYFGNDDIEIISATKVGQYMSDQHLLPKYIMHWCREASYGVWMYKEIYNWNKPKPLSIYYNLLLKNGLI